MVSLSFLIVTLLSSGCQKSRPVESEASPIAESVSIVVATPTPQSPFSFGFAPAQYDNVIYAYQLNRATGEILPTAQASIPTQTLPISSAISADHHYLFAANYSSNSISSYSVNSDNGELALITHFALPASSAPGWLSSHPALPVLYVANSGTGMIAVLDVDRNGGLSLRNLVAAGSGVTSFAINAAGTVLFSAEQSLNQVSSFDVDSAGGLSLSHTFAMAANTQPNQLELSKSGRFLYTANWGTSSVSAFLVHGDELSSLGPDVNAGGAVFTVNISPDEKFAYAMQPYSKQYSTHAIAADGSLGAAVIRAKAGAVWMTFWSQFAFLTSWTYNPAGLSIESHANDSIEGAGTAALFSGAPHRGQYQMTILDP